MGIFHAKFTINGMMLIFRLKILLTWMGMFLVEHPTVFISRNLFGSPEYLIMFLTNIQNKLLTAKLLNLGYRYHKLHKAFSRFYRHHFELVSKFSVGIKSQLKQGLSESEFYGYKHIYACNDFSAQFRKTILRCIKIVYNINVMRQNTCMVVNPITINNFASLFGCMPAGSGLRLYDISGLKTFK